MHSLDAIRGLEPASPSPSEPEVRVAEMNDLEALMRLDDRLWRHIRGAPTFLPNQQRGRAYWEEWLQDDPTRNTWLASVDDKPVAFLSLGPANDDVSAIIVDGGTASIYGAFTERDVRGRGIATALLNCALEHARAQGYQRCAVDFESANLEGARFWCRHFRPICFSLFRQIDGTMAHIYTSP